MNLGWLKLSANLDKGKVCVHSWMCECLTECIRRRKPRNKNILSIFFKFSSSPIFLLILFLFYPVLLNSSSRLFCTLGIMQGKTNKIKVKQRKREGRKEGRKKRKHFLPPPTDFCCCCKSDLDATNPPHASTHIWNAFTYLLLLINKSTSR